MEARDNLVFDATAGGLAASSARWNACHFRPARLGRRFLGSAIG